MKTLKKAIEDTLEAIRQNLACAKGDERTVYEEFVDEIGSEIDGWKMRLEELISEEE